MQAGAHSLHGADVLLRAGLKESKAGRRGWGSVLSMRNIYKSIHAGMTSKGPIYISLKCKQI